MADGLLPTKRNFFFYGASLPTLAPCPPPPMIPLASRLPPTPVYSAAAMFAGPTFHAQNGPK